MARITKFVQVIQNLGRVISFHLKKDQQLHWNAISMWNSCLKTVFLFSSWMCTSASLSSNSLLRDASAERRIECRSTYWLWQFLTDRMQRSTHLCMTFGSSRWTIIAFQSSLSHSATAPQMSAMNTDCSSQPVFQSDLQLDFNFRSFLFRISECAS